MTKFYESIPSDLTSEIIDYCLHHYPQLDLTMEVKDEWFGLRQYNYTTMNARSNPIVKSLRELKQYEATKILLSGKHQIPGLISKFGQQVNILITDKNQLIQIMPLQASKELAITRLCNIYNEELDSLIVFGDDHNDVGLFKSTAYSIAMGNAVVELKDIADEITETNDNDGVAIILEGLCGKQKL